MPAYHWLLLYVWEIKVTDRADGLVRKWQISTHKPEVGLKMKPDSVVIAANAPDYCPAQTSLPLHNKIMGSTPPLVSKSIPFLKEKIINSFFLVPDTFSQNNTFHHWLPIANIVGKKYNKCCVFFYAIQSNFIIYLRVSYHWHTDFLWFFNEQTGWNSLAQWLVVCR